MYVAFYLLFLIGTVASVAFVACIVWLHWRALQDGAIQDLLLFVTGISILSYIFNRWDRAKRPVLGVIGALLLGAIVASVSNRIGVASHEPSPDELATEVKSMILQEWKKDPGLRSATIENIFLAHKGGGLYSGFIEATIDGRRERFSLEVVLDRESIRWEIKPAHLAAAAINAFRGQTLTGRHGR